MEFLAFAHSVLDGPPTVAAQYWASDDCGSDEVILLFAPRVVLRLTDGRLVVRPDDLLGATGACTAVPVLEAFGFSHVEALDVVTDVPVLGLHPPLHRELR